MILGGNAENWGWECRKYGECGEWSGNSGDLVGTVRNQGGSSENRGGNAGNKKEIKIVTKR